MQGRRRIEGIARKRAENKTWYYVPSTICVSEYSAHIRMIRASNLDWTLACVLLLDNKPKTGNIKTGYLGRNELGTRVSRADLADFMLKQVKDTKLFAKRRSSQINIGFRCACLSASLDFA